MNMHNTRSLLPCSRTTLLTAACVISGLCTTASARGGDHTDFPDLRVGAPPGQGGYQAPKKIYDAIIGVIVDGEGNPVHDNSLVAPNFPSNFPPKPILPEHGYTFEPASSSTSSGGAISNVSSIPTPGVGSMLVVGAAAAALRRRRR